jgi:two-component system LytT family response regulator
MIRAVIVDDEFKGIEILKLLLKHHCPEVEIIGQAEEINDAVNLIRDAQPDLIFLDIEMSGGTCFEILEQVKALNFHLILVTAHSEYAVKAFRYSVVDYLLKPVDIIEL